MLDHLLVVPARYASSRFPGKPLVEIEGKPMICHTLERCLEATTGEHIVLATDDQRIADACHKYPIAILLTSDQCKTGTDRVAEVAKKIAAQTYINVQGDEPRIPPSDIQKVIATARKHRDEIINGYAPILQQSGWNSRDVPKVVFRPDGRLLYMSRSPIPGNKQLEFEWGFRQICVYAFPPKALEAFAACVCKTPLEEQEDIEILRFLELHYEVRMVELSQGSISVDRPEDLKKLQGNT